MISVGLVKGVLGAATSFGTGRIIGSVIKATVPASKSAIVNGCTYVAGMVAASYTAGKLVEHTDGVIDEIADAIKGAKEIEAEKKED